MRLIDTSSLAFHEYLGSDIPPYAILSHTWGKDEVEFKDWGLPSAKSKGGYAKIHKACELAAAMGIEHAWVDTCCIDKSSSAELTEAINSMFSWYYRAEICFAHLSDLDVDAKVSAEDTSESALGKCRWFRRGWTLQELIAPKIVQFYDQEWKHRGNKANLLATLSNITGIDSRVLDHKLPLSAVSVGEKLSWAAGRTTTREEDMAYSLLGICDVNMPLLYGEGSKSFFRLQMEIIKGSNDMSIFAWEDATASQEENPLKYCSILATTPAMFARCRNITDCSFSADQERSFDFTNGGLRLKSRLQMVQQPNGRTKYGLRLCMDENNKDLFIYLRKCGPNVFVRQGAALQVQPHPWLDAGTELAVLHILSKIPHIESALENPQGDFAVEGRFSCVQLRLPEVLLVDGYAASPTPLWDEQDRVIFSPDARWETWAGISVEGRLNIYGYEHDVELGIYFYDWSDEGELQAYFIDTDKIDIGRVYPLDNEWHTSSAMFKRQFVPHGVPTMSNKVGGMGIHLRLETEKVIDLAVCPTPFWRVNIIIDMKRLNVFKRVWYTLFRRDHFIAKF